MKVTTSFDVVGPHGTRLTVTPRTTADTVGELAIALGCPRPVALWVDGRRAAAGQRLVDVPGLRAGAQLDVGRPPGVGAICPARVDLTARHGVSAGRGATTADGGSDGPGSAPAVVEVAVVAGPACRPWRPLAPGRHSIGRSVHCAIRLDDPRAELHHARLDVDGDGGAWVTQLTGRVPVRLAGEPCRPRHPVPDGALLEVGSSLLAVRPVASASCAGPAGHRPDPAAGGSVVAGPDPWRRTVRRGPPRPSDWDWPHLAAPPRPAPHPPPPATGLIGAAVAATGALLVATVLGQPMFALFSLIGAAASLVAWAGGSAAASRRRRIAGRAHAAAVAGLADDIAVAVAGWRAHHRVRCPTITDTLTVTAADAAGGLWSHRPGDDPALPVTVGLGFAEVRPPVDGWSSLDAEIDGERVVADELEPAGIELRPGEGLAVQGDSGLARAVVRGLLVHLATWVGPADWQLLVVSHHVDRWDWARWLPHAARSDGSLGVVDVADVEAAGTRLADDRITVVVTDDPGLFDARTGPARRLVSRRQAIVLAALGRDDVVPALFGRVLGLGSTGRGEWARGPAPDAVPGPLRVTGVDQSVAAAVARRLAALSDPEDPAGADASVPATLRFADLDDRYDRRVDGHGTTADASDVDRADDDPLADLVARRWQAAGADPPPRGPIGISADGSVDIDLVRDGPHGLIAGTTGAGKSELLRTVVLTLATRCSPDHLTFVLVDYKGGATFDACARLPHVVGLVTDLDEGGAERSLVSMEAELRRRERLLRDLGAADLAEYRTRPAAAPLPRLAVVVDEFAALSQELPGFVGSLVGIAQRGRSLGVHLLLATQRPAGVVSDDIRANTNLRLALRLHDVADARDVVGDELPATFSRRQVGRAVLRLGPGELVVFQAARCTGPDRPASQRVTVTVRGGPTPGGDGRVEGATELSRMVDAVCRAAARLEIGRPHRPWVDPLPALLDAAAVDRAVGGSVPHRAVGLLDDPAEQCRRVLRWDVERGPLALTGPIGSGATSTLVALAAAECRTAPPNRLHLYVVDAVGEPLLDELAALAHCGAVVRAGEAERLHRLLVRLVAEIDRRQHEADVSTRIVLLIDGLDSLRAALSPIDRVATQTLLDRVVADGPPAGIAVAFAGGERSRVDVGDTWHYRGPARPGRIVVESTGLEAQLATGGPGPARIDDAVPGDGPRPVEALVAHVGRSSLRSSWATDDEPATAHLVVGLGVDGMEEVALTVPAGDHVLVGGPSGSGKTTALRSVAAAWRDLHPGGMVVEVDRHRRLGTIEPGTATLVVVDDADRIDDPELAELVVAHRIEVTVLIAARLEAVRARYGHWTRDVARSRCGLVLTSSGETDGELLGVTLPSRTLIPPRPGLAWLVDRRGSRLAQLAVPDG